MIEASSGISDRIDEMLDVIGKEACPEAVIGRHCSDPYVCPMTDCWEFLPQHSVFTLHYGGKKTYELFDNGILAIEDIPDSFALNAKQLIQKNCIATGEAFVDKGAIRQFLGELEYPLHFLDFETIGTAIPLFDKSRPYQNIPFQFSLHRQETEGGPLEHYSFLA